jgi:hypothetical protein
MTLAIFHTNLKLVTIKGVTLMPVFKSVLALIILALTAMAVMGFGHKFSWAYASADEVPKLQSEPNRDKDNSESKKDDFQKWALFPIISSSAETGLMLGGLAVRFFEPPSPDIRTNSIDFMVFGSMKEQYNAIVAPNLYFKDELYHLKFTMAGALWPANYYGIGNDTHKDNKEKYESTSFSTLLLFERKFEDKIYIGANYFISYEELDIEEDGALESNDILGAKDGLNSGPGIAVTLDTRDNENDARSGSFINFRSNWFSPAFGGDYTFEKYEIFLGRYIPIAKVTGLALGGQINLTRGDIPFTGLNSPDGVKILRGIENGRYRDRDMAALQVEYRFPIANRWGAALFAETAQVAHKIGDLTMDGWKYSLGTGIRYALNPSERFNLRLDVSFVDDGFGLVLNIREAF